jgi:hypothetical protein
VLDNKVQDLITLPPDAKHRDCPTLLDAKAVNGFLDWLDVNPDFERQLREDRSIRIGGLRHHLESRPDWKTVKDRRGETIEIGLKERLELQGIDLLRYRPSRDEALIDEMQRAYFGNDPADRKSAELLAYGRRHANDGGPVRIISRHRGFRAAPRIELYVLNLDDVGIDNESAYLRMFAALDLHPKVVHAAFKRLESGDYPVAVFETVKTFVHEIRLVGRHHSLAFAAVRNDQPMVDQALQCTEPDPGRGRPARMPHIQLNDLSLGSEWSEQKGYHNIMCGVVSAVRNPTAHTPADKTFIRDRFGDRVTALKFLCLLSLLFEKLDKRVAP